MTYFVLGLLIYCWVVWFWVLDVRCLVSWLLFVVLFVFDNSVVSFYNSSFVCLNVTIVNAGDCLIALLFKCWLIIVYLAVCRWFWILCLCLVVLICCLLCLFVSVVRFVVLGVCLVALSLGFVFRLYVFTCFGVLLTGLYLLALGFRLLRWFGFVYGRISVNLFWKLMFVWVGFCKDLAVWCLSVRGCLWVCLILGFRRLPIWVFVFDCYFECGGFWFDSLGFGDLVFWINFCLSFDVGYLQFWCGFWLFGVKLAKLSVLV